jgi:hypothetical protein
MLGGTTLMKTWHIILIGAITGPLIGFPFLAVVQSYMERVSADHWFLHRFLDWFFYPVEVCAVFLSSIFSPNQDMAGIVFAFPLMALYFATLGVVIVLTARYCWRRMSV